MSGGCRVASDLMDDALGMSGYDPDAMDKVIQADGLTGGHLMDDAFGMSGYDPDAKDKVIQAEGLTV